MLSVTPFRIFDLQHIAVLGGLVGFCVLTGWAARHLEPSVRRRIGLILAGVLLVYVCVLYIQKAGTVGLQAAHSLPMQLCDWVLIACLITLAHPNRTGAEIAYFWGLGGTLQALITPDVATGFPSWRFIQFFWGHGTVLLAIMFIIATPGFRPRRWSVLRMFALLNVYGFAALALDLLFGWNYGYLRHKPAGASLFDYLGPWPWYILSLELLAVAIFTLLYLPWKLQRKRKALPSE